VIALHKSACLKVKLIAKIVGVCCLRSACFQSWCHRRHSSPWRVSRISSSRSMWVASCCVYL